MKKYLGLIIVVLGAVTAVFVAHANPIRQAQTVQTATATSSFAFITPGTGTSTVTYDTFVNGSTQMPDKLALLIQFTASSTSSTLLTNIEYSNDGVDWYQKGIDDLLATTSAPVSLGNVPQYSWLFASSTPGLGAVSGTNNRDGRSIILNVPTRYVRAIFSMKIGGTNGSVWAQIVPQKQGY